MRYVKKLDVDAALTSIFRDKDEYLRQQPRQLVPEGWYGYPGQKKYSREEVRSILIWHVRFLESFIRGGNLVLYRAMHLKGRLPRRGSIVNLGSHWTYSGDADLSSAEPHLGVGAGYNVAFKALVSASRIRWVDTLVDHMGRWYGEKQIFVDGSVKVLNAWPYRMMRKVAHKRNFEVWLRKRLKRGS